MAKIQLLLISSLCYFTAQATHYYELDLSENDPPTPARLATEIAFGPTHPVEEYSKYEMHVRPRRQVSGGVIVYPGSETRRSNYIGTPFLGSLPQAANSRPGFTKPIPFAGRVAFSSATGHGISGKVNMHQGIRGQASARGLMNGPNHQISGWAQHNRNFDRNVNVLGRKTNSVGLTKDHLIY